MALGDLQEIEINIYFRLIGALPSSLCKSNCAPKTIPNLTLNSVHGMWKYGTNHVDNEKKMQAFLLKYYQLMKTVS